jgi:hypothetical protein
VASVSEAPKVEAPKVEAPKVEAPIGDELDAFDLAVEHIKYLIEQHDESILVPFFGSIRKMFKVDDLKNVDVKLLANFADRLQERFDSGELAGAVDSMMSTYTGRK